MYDPNKKFSADDAEAALGMEEDDKAFLRMIVTIDLYVPMLESATKKSGWHMNRNSKDIY